jgi:tyrosine-specific transport protein
MPEWMGPLPLLGIFGYFVYKGTRSVDYANRILMAGLVIAYGLMVVFLSPHVEKELLAHMDWRYLLMGVSVVATSFGFHIIIPSLTTYFDRDASKLRKAILIGSAIPLGVYIVWEFLALGIIPLQGEYGIEEGYLHGSNGAHLLAAVLGHSSLAVLARFFSLFAIVTSFLGVSLSLTDFLADGLKIKKTRLGRLTLYLLTFFPPLLIALADPRAFLSALEYAGAFGVVVLLGLFPALMAWSGRYYKNLSLPDGYKVAGGKIALMAAIVFSLVIIAIEIMHKLG